MADLNPEQQKQVDDLIFGGRKIEAIKQWRETTGTGLKEAKDAVDARETELRRQSPQSFSSKSGGCLSVIIFGLSGLAVLIWTTVRALA